MKAFRERAHVEQLVGVETAVGRRGDVADVVGAGAARGEAELLESHQDADDVARTEFAELEIGAGGDVAVSAAPLREVGEAVELVRGDFAGRQPQAEHEAVLRRRDMEEAVEFEAEAIGLVGEFVGVGMGDEFFPDIERVLVVFPALGFAEFAERRAEDGVLGGRSGEVDRRRVGRRGELTVGGVTGERRVRGEGREEALQVLLLLRRKSGGGWRCGGHGGREGKRWECVRGARRRRAKDRSESPRAYPADRRAGPLVHAFVRVRTRARHGPEVRPYTRLSG